MIKKICVITGSRAEFGLLKPLLIKIEEDKDLVLQLIVTGMHMDFTCGLTYREIENDGFFIDEKVEMNVSADTASGTCKSMGLGIIGLSDAYLRLTPDMVILLGDRYEIFMAAAAAMMHGIPIAHIHGGELTMGAFDDSIRHAVTKMSYLHFTSTEEYRRRVIQLGEEPSRVYNVGALGIEVMRGISVLSPGTLEKMLGISLNKPYILAAFHPVTLEKSAAPEHQIASLLETLDNFPEFSVIFTGSNGDAGGRTINNKVRDYVKTRKDAFFFHSLGSLAYLSLMKYSRILIGNSSSGILEAPFYKIASVNIGDRQMGRVKPDSVIDCRNEKESMISAVREALSYRWEEDKSNNPYENNGTSNRIITIVKDTLKKEINLKKVFYDWT